jgi:acetoin utilization deacetylase AcuC-like enzyme
MPLFPGTGAMSERGEYDNVVNAPLRAGDNGETFREALDIAIQASEILARPYRHLSWFRRTQA